MTDWRTIETAPMDGREVLLSGPAFNDESRGQYISCGSFENGKWASDHEIKGLYLYTPTHWMPLPLPPRPIA